MQQTDPSPDMILGAAHEIAAKLSTILNVFPPQPITLSRDEAILALGLIEAAAARLASEISTSKRGPT